MAAPSRIEEPSGASGFVVDTTCGGLVGFRSRLASGNVLQIY